MKLLRAGNFAADCFVLLEGFLFAICPLCENREGEQARLNDESERGLVLEIEGNSVIVAIGREFYALNDLAGDFG
ncbi:MAG: hypothetical protein DMG65_05130 [Candidatus Angelobacter sp. Gp1-AA117]|nr:MAG: hypothetical protein DMG65_05130 [Candidatus Angelobacter sp. Gp1-AA117]